MSNHVQGEHGRARVRVPGGTALTKLSLSKWLGLASRKKQFKQNPRSKKIVEVQIWLCASGPSSCDWRLVVLPTFGVFQYFWSSFDFVFVILFWCSCDFGRVAKMLARLTRGRSLYIGVIFGLLFLVYFLFVDQLTSEKAVLRGHPSAPKSHAKSHEALQSDAIATITVGLGPAIHDPDSCTMQLLMDWVRENGGKIADIHEGDFLIENTNDDWLTPRFRRCTEPIFFFSQKNKQRFHGGERHG